MIINYDNNKKSIINKGNENKAVFIRKKTGNHELDKSLEQLAYNSMPNIVHLIVGGLSQ